MLAVHLLVQRTDDSRKEDRLFFIGNEIFLEELLTNSKLFWKHVEVVEILTEIPVEKDFKDYFVKSSEQIVCSD
jgi:hypothetical protein